MLLDVFEGVGDDVGGGKLLGEEPPELPVRGHSPPTATMGPCCSPPPPIAINCDVKDKTQGPLLLHGRIAVRTGGVRRSRGFVAFRGGWVRWLFDREKEGPVRVCFGRSAVVRKGECGGVAMVGGGFWDIMIPLGAVLGEGGVVVGPTR